MTDFGEKAWEDGFSDEVEYMDYLMHEAGRELRRDFEDNYDTEEDLDPVFLASEKIALQLKNLENIASISNCKIVHDFGFNLSISDIDNFEVSRNLDFCRLLWGNILDVIYAPKEDIIKFNKLFNKEFSIDDVKDDVYFIKRTHHYNMHIWVGSPVESSVEKEYIIRAFKEGFIVKAIVTNEINTKDYTYCLMQGVVPPVNNFAIPDDDDYE